MKRKLYTRIEAIKHSVKLGCHRFVFESGDHIIMQSKTHFMRFALSEYGSNELVKQILIDPKWKFIDKENSSAKIKLVVDNS